LTAPISQNSQSVHNGMSNFHDPPATVKALSNTSASLRNVCCLAASGTLERRQRLKIASEEPRDEARALLTITLARTHSSHTHRITPLSLMSERAEYAPSGCIYCAIYIRVWWSVIRQRSAVIQKRIAQVIECPPRSSLTLLWLSGACVPLLSVYLCVRVNN